MFDSINCTVRTERLVLRPWTGDDAVELAPILQANVPHLSPWIPQRVWEPAPPEELRERLAGFATAFATDLEWRYAMRLRADGRLLGEVALFPRDASGRVAFASADRVEMGYWLRADETGRGLVAEAATALIAEARRLARVSRLEIRCDERNTSSVAIPRRLGMELEDVSEDSENGARLQTWTLPLGPS